MLVFVIVSRTRGVGAPSAPSLAVVAAAQPQPAYLDKKHILREQPDLCWERLLTKQIGQNVF